jgi:hypothetical protein
MRKQVFAPVCLQPAAPRKGDIPNELFHEGAVK